MISADSRTKMSLIASKSLWICFWMLLFRITAAHDPNAPSHEHPSTSTSLLPSWVSPSGIYHAILSRHGSTRCSSRDGFQGICEPVEKCTSHAGTFRSSHVCAREGQVCCSVSPPKPTATCGRVIDKSGTHFVNFPNEDITELCGILVRIPPSVCQMRLDFLAFKISQPTTDLEDKARCTDDVFSLHMGSGSVAYPNICGDNDNQHLLIAVNGSEHVYLNMKLAPYLVGVKRYWNIKVTFQTCDSLDLAPAGCLQQYTAKNGAVRPFNFGPSNQLIEGLKYQVCLMPKTNSCQILVNNRLHNIRGPVFLNFVSQEFTSVSIGPLYTLRNDTGQITSPVTTCRKRLGKSVQAKKSPVPTEPMKYSVEESSPELLEWLITGSVKSLDWNYLKNVELMEPKDDGSPPEGVELRADGYEAAVSAGDFGLEGNQGDGSSTISRDEAVRMTVDSIFDGRISNANSMTRRSESQDQLGAGPRETENFAQFVLEVPVDGITPSLQKVLDKDDYLTELLRTHDHDHDHHHHEENNMTTVVPEHPDRAWIQQLHAQHTQAVLDRLNALAQNHSSSSHHGSSEHNGTSEHHGSLNHHEGSEHHGSLEHPAHPDHQGTLEDHGAPCHRGSHAHDVAHPHLPPCETEAEGVSTTPAPMSSTPVPPAEVFVSPVEETQLVIDDSEDNKEDDDGPDPSMPPLRVELNKPEDNSTTPEPADECTGFKLTTNVTEECLQDAHPEKCYFDSLHSHRSSIHENIAKCNYSASQLLAHQHEFEEQALQHYHALTIAIHSHPVHPTHKPHTSEHVHPTHEPHTGEYVHPTHSPHVHPGHTSHGGHLRPHPGHSSGSIKPNGTMGSMNEYKNQMVVPVVVYIPIKSTIYNQFTHKKVYQVNANLTQLLEESLRNSSSNQFLIEIGNPRATGEEQPEIMTFNSQFELLYSFESC